HRLDIVVTGTRCRPDIVPATSATPWAKKTAYCDDGGISCQFRALEHIPGGHGHPGMDDHAPALRKLHGHELLPHTLGPGRRTSNKNRDIRAQWQPQPGQLVNRETAAP